MRSFDRSFREMIGALAEDEIADHLEDAASALASMDGPIARSITSTVAADPASVASVREAADRIARRYGLGLRIEERVSIRVRFTR